MSLNGPSIRLLVNELNNKMHDGRVDKIYQENKDIYMLIRASGKNQILYFSFSADSPALYITDNKLDSPKEPPMFCMLLRKYLIGSKLNSIKQIGLDRIISLEFTTSSEIYDIKNIEIRFELMGKYSNLILINKDSREIIDSLIRVYPDMSSVRLVLPKEQYIEPPRNGICPLDNNINNVLNMLEENELQSLKQAIYKNIEGFNPDIASIILYNANIEYNRNYNSLDDNEKNSLINSIKDIFNKIIDYKLDSYIYYRDGKAKIISAFNLDPIYHKGKHYENMNFAVREFFESKGTAKILDSRIYELRHKINNKIANLEKTLAIQQEDLIKSRDREHIKIKADLLAANIYKINRGDTSIVANNFYSENNEEVKIPLDEKLSPKQNVEHYYARYNKLKSREHALEKRLPKTKNEIYYLKSVIINLEQATTTEEINSIKNELISSGFLKEHNSNKIRNPKLEWREYISPSGIKILAGRNNIQNDQLSFKIAHKDDLWFHLRNEPGSHVILTSHDSEYTEDDITYAASIAATLSNKTTKSDVDYTIVKNVKKIPGAKPGLVNYYNFKTITVEPIKLDK